MRRRCGHADRGLAVREPLGYRDGMPSDAPTLHRTPFHAYHLEHGGRMVEFAGW